MTDQSDSSTPRFCGMTLQAGLPLILGVLRLPLFYMSKILPLTNMLKIDRQLAREQRSLYVCTSTRTRSEHFS
jgi:hypothetical protein